MANGSVPSSDTDPFFQQLPDQLPAAPKVDPFFEDLRKEQIGQLEVQARAARVAAPEKWAKARQLSGGLPVDTVLRNLPEVEQNQQMAKYRSIFESNDALRNHYTQNPNDLALAHPDELDKVSGIDWLIKAPTQAFQSGVEDVATSTLGFKDFLGQATPEELARIDADETGPSRTFGAQGWLEGGVTGLAQMLPQMGTVIAAGAGAGAGGAGVGAGIGSLAGGVGAAPGAAVGFSVGALTGSLTANATLAVGDAFNTYKRLKDENGQFIDPNIARVAALATGATSALLEQYGMSKTIGQIPGLDKIFSGLSKAEMATALKNPTTRETLKNFTSRLGIGVAAEMSTEVAQEAVTILNQEAAKAVAPGEFEKLGPMEIAERLGETIVQTAQVMTLLGPFAAGAGMMGELRTLRKSKQANDKFQEIAEKATTELGEFMQRDPVAAAAVIDSQAPDQKVYIPAKEMVEYFQTEGKDPYAVDIANWRTTLDEALATSSPVELSLGQFLAHLAKDPKDRALRDLVRTDPEDFTRQEMEKYSKEFDEKVKGVVEKSTTGMGDGTVPKAIPAPAVQAQIKQQLVDAGFDESVADDYATVQASMYQTLADKAERTPEEIYAQVGARIQSAEAKFADAPDGAKGKTVFTEAMVDAVATPEPAPGMIRFYHGTVYEDASQFGGKTFLAPKYEYAKNYRPGQSNVLYTDFTREEAIERGLYDDINEYPQIGSIDDGKDRLKRLVVPGDKQVTSRFAAPPVIQLFETRDLSTLLHETGHLFLETYVEMASTVPAIQADLDIIREKLGNDGGAFTRDQHEKFAQWLEAYYLEGKSPTPELRRIFTRFKTWLSSIYRYVTNVGGRVPPEIAEVFDRMHATEDRLAEVAEGVEYTGIFKTAEEMGLPPEEFLAYHQLLDDARKTALDKARGSAVGKHVRLMKGWQGTIAKELFTQVRDRLLQTAPYKHMEAFKQPDFRINRADLVEQFGADAESYFPRGAVRKDGIPVEVVAQVLEYPSADDMLYDFRQAPPLREVVKEEVQREMKARFGDDLADSATLDLAVKRALATDSRKTILGAEIKALNAKGGRNADEKTAIRIANEIARKTVYGKSVAEVLRLERAYRAEGARNARAADAAVVRGDWARAAEAKRAQLVNFALEQEAINVAKTVERIRSKAVRYTRTSSKSISPRAMEQIRELVTRFEFAKRSNKVLREREELKAALVAATNDPASQMETLVQYLNDRTANGEVPVVDERFLNELRRVNYKTLSVEEILGFGEALESLEHMGRKENKALIEGRKIAFEEAIQKYMDDLPYLDEKPIRMETYSTAENGWRQKGSRALAYMLKPERIMLWLGNDNPSSPWVKMFNSFRDAGVKQKDMMQKYATQIIEVFDAVDRKDLEQMVRVESLPNRQDGKGKLLKKSELYAFALNTGNASNHKKLQDGRGLSDVQIADMMSHLTLEDMRRVQKIWDILGGLWPEIDAMEKRITGVSVKRIERKRFFFKGEWFEGGYYPAVYDRTDPSVLAKLAEDAAKGGPNLEFKDLFAPPAQMRPGTEHGYTKTRVITKLPISSELNIIVDHLNTVIHDLTHRELVQTNAKILWDPRIQQGISAAQSPAVYNQLREWMKNIATPERHIRDNNSIFSQAASKLRGNMIIFSFAWRATTGVAQLGGFFNSREKVGGKALRSAGLRWIGNPRKYSKSVEDASGFMKHRFAQSDRDLRDNLKKFALKDSKLDKVRYWSTLHIAKMDQMVSTITWMGAYEEAINANPADHDAAVKIADSAVALTQGTGNVEDMAGIQMDRGIASLFTMFYSAFNAQFNAYIDMGRKTPGVVVDGSWSARTELLTQWMCLTILPAVVIAGLTGDIPDDDESWLGWMVRKTLLQGFGTVPVVREIGSAMDSWYTGKNFGYTATPLNRIGDSLTKALQEAALLASGDENADLRDAARYAATASGMIAGLPIGGLINPINTVWKGLEQGDFELGDLFLGRGDKK